MVALHQEIGNIVDVVDATLELVRRAEVVDADQQGLALSSTLTILERVAVGCAVAETLLALGHVGLLLTTAVLLGRGLLVLVLLGRVLAVVLLRRILLLLRRVVGVVWLGRAMMVAVALLRGRRAPMSRRRSVVTSGAVALSWIHAVRDAYADVDAMRGVSGAGCVDARNQVAQSWEEIGWFRTRKRVRCRLGRD